MRRMAVNVFCDSYGSHFPVMRGTGRPDAAELRVKVEVGDFDSMASAYYCYSAETMTGSAMELAK